MRAPAWAPMSRPAVYCVSLSRCVLHRVCTCSGDAGDHARRDRQVHAAWTLATTPTSLPLTIAKHRLTTNLLTGAPVP